MKRLLPILLLASAVAFAQPVRKIFEIKNADVNRLAKILSIFDARLMVDENLKIISAQGDQASISALEEAIKRFDVPPPPEKNIEITVHLVYATQQPGATKLPAGLEPVAKQLRAIFPFQTYTLLDTHLVRTRDGRDARANGALRVPGQPDGVAGTVQLGIRRAAVSALEKANVIRIDAFELILQVPTRQSTDEKGRPYWQFDRADISASVDVPEGKRTVVGKATVQNTETAIFAVLDARVVE
ncbi:MAG TPA: hypothetical protein DEH78_05590 [Solibacterales bacterium]|nr:hypothetical protein [Bryobacterales bacterium]